ncbi:hypothetical protein ACW9UR_01635 [Halovulum sp. GXIMD14794]
MRRLLAVTTCCALLGSALWTHAQDSSVIRELVPTALPAETALPDLDPLPDDIRWDAVLTGLAALMEALEDPDDDMDELAFGFDGPDDAFVFVRDRIRTEPYAGSLRTPQAVLDARAGNPQDKASLLVELLIRMGFDARVMRADTPVPAEALAGVCAVPARSDVLSLRLAGLGEQAETRLITRAGRDFARLQESSDAAGARAEALPSVPHAWVRMADLGQFTDYDPARPDAQPGEAPGTAGTPLDGPADAHEVTIAVYAEQLADGRLSERKVLDQSFAARDLAHVPIHLVFGPEQGGTGGILAEALSAVAGVQAGMKPTLIVDGDFLTGSAFATPGLAAERGLAEGDDPVVTAVWLDISTKAPGQPERRARRALIDLLPPEARAAASVSEDDLRPPTMGERFPAALETVRHLAVSNGGLSALAAAAHSADGFLRLPDLLADGEAADPVSLLALDWTTLEVRAQAAEALARALPAEHDGACAFIGQPRVWLASTAPLGEAIETTLDWAIDGIDVAGPTGEPAPEAAFDLRLWYGALQSALETTLAEAGVTGTEVEIASTSTLLDAPLTGQATALAETHPAAARDAEAGYVLLTADSGLERGAWWRIDPATGQTDARLGEVGNAFKKIQGIGGIGVKQGIYQVDPVTGESIRLNPRGDIEAQSRKAEKILRDRRARYNRYKANAQRTKGGGNEYSVLLTTVAIPISFAGGYAIGTAVYQGAFYALYGYVP